MLIDICIKFREYSLSGFQVIERTQFVTDRQTDRRTDRRTDRQTDARGKTICLPTLKGGDIMTTEKFNGFNTEVGPNLDPKCLIMDDLFLQPVNNFSVMSGWVFCVAPVPISLRLKCLVPLLISC